MPPVRTTSKNTAFKPPRRVSGKSNTSDPDISKAPAPRATAAAAGSTSRPAASASRVAAFRPATTLISSDTDLDDIDDDSHALDEEINRRRSTNAGADNDASTSNAVAVPPASQDSMGTDDQPPIPPKLLNRLLHEGFQDEEVRIGKEAMAVASKYVETFVREALARAMYEREEADGKKKDDSGDGFLQVEDLEKLAPQLLLDF
ncbi:centromere protein x [Diplodia corticola]|uniref:Centromere protein x n=1 Tax=Diplodia corticola TaxID=236234 RepID=A0A1J9S3B3_9PEZI|nr:centromere protein x [Diplodia corticola]OJD34492.1 centromere protein x [Diplodia corticola]